ncbi:MAG: hypothetical protein GXP31_19010 [Kiritimatiellaeota bacterium]|nr:hypothetical protein [Kiritimatiellota bacterium]
MQYIIRRTSAEPAPTADWNAPVWRPAAELAIDSFRPESSDHRPETQARLLYDNLAIHGVYRVADRYVRCVHEGFQAPVCRDSCVEFFFKPHKGPGYFNFEFNCGGNFLCSYIRDWTRIGDVGFADFTKLTPEQCSQVTVSHSMPTRVDPEIATPTVWTIQFRIPFEVVQAYTGALDDLSGVRWSGNFYKCGDETSHPHWAAWAPVDELNFHLPRCFGTIMFE